MSKKYFVDEGESFSGGVQTLNERTSKLSHNLFQKKQSNFQLSLDCFAVVSFLATYKISHNCRRLVIKTFLLMFLGILVKATKTANRLEAADFPPKNFPAPGNKNTYTKSQNPTADS